MSGLLTAAAKRHVPAHGGEHAIETVNATVDTSPPLTDQPADAGPPANVATKNGPRRRPEDLARSVADMQTSPSTCAPEAVLLQRNAGTQRVAHGTVITVVAAAVAVRGVIVSNNSPQQGLRRTDDHLPAQRADSAKIDDLVAAVTRDGDRIGLMT
ncbi:MAG: hypothetical protein IPG34_19370 [Rhodocyclaceae bacterium]|nr:hypothetical protein [Rhodocyclaceae bacterium]